MGLIKAIINSPISTIRDTWQDLIKCDNMDNDTLMVRVTAPKGQISKGSRILVAPGQVAVIYDSGAVVDATAEEGVYNFDASSSPSFFAGQFGPVFKEMWERFKYGGNRNKEQAVFYFNAKEILDNKFGTPAPVPYQDWSHAIPNQMTGAIMPLSVSLRCFGKYTFRLDDMGVFMRGIGGTGDVVKKDALTEQMRSEVIASFQNVLNELGNSQHRIPVLELPSNTDEIKQIMDERVFDEPIRNRGIRLVSFTVESVTLDPESQKKITEYEHNANSMMQQGRIIDVMGQAAGNAGGAMQGFMGLGMMNMGTGGMSGGVMQNAFQNPGQQQAYDPYAQQAQPAVPQASVKCPTCGTMITGKFCPECGTPAPAPAAERRCPKCGTVVTGKFCPECGTPVPQGPRRCPKCGTETDSIFCPECGTKID